MPNRTCATVRPWCVPCSWWAMTPAASRTTTTKTRPWGSGSGGGGSGSGGSSSSCEVMSRSSATKCGWGHGPTVAAAAAAAERWWVLRSAASHAWPLVRTRPWSSGSGGGGHCAACGRATLARTLSTERSCRRAAPVQQRWRL